MNQCGTRPAFWFWWLSQPQAVVDVQRATPASPCSPGSPCSLRGLLARWFLHVGHRARWPMLVPSIGSLRRFGCPAQSAGSSRWPNLPDKLPEQRATAHQQVGQAKVVGGRECFVDRGTVHGSLKHAQAEINRLVVRGCRPSCRATAWRRIGRAIGSRPQSSKSVSAMIAEVLVNFAECLIASLSWQIIEGPSIKSRIGKILCESSLKPQ